MNSTVHNKIKVGIIGVGNLGMQYINRLQHNAYYEIIGYSDVNAHLNNYLEDEFALINYDNAKRLFEACDAVIICTPNQSIMKYLHVGIKTGKHIFLGRPLIHEISELLYIEDLVREAGIKMQVSLADSFSPIFKKLKEIIEEPVFVEMKRSITFETSKNNTQMIQESLLKDICLLLDITKGKVQKVRYSNVFKQMDFVQIRIEFDNGSAAHISINQISNTKSFSIQAYQSSKVITANLSNRRMNIVTQRDTHLKLSETNFELEEIDTVSEELNAFAESILFNKDCSNSITDFFKASELTYKILKSLEEKDKDILAS